MRVAEILMMLAIASFAAALAYETIRLGREGEARLAQAKVIETQAGSLLKMEKSQLKSQGDQLQALLGRAGDAVTDLDSTIRATNNSLNKQVMPQVVASVGALHTSLASLNDSIRATKPVLANANRSVIDLDALIANPDIPKTLAHTNSTMANIDTISANGAKASALGLQKLHQLLKPASFIKRAANYVVNKVIEFLRPW